MPSVAYYGIICDGAIGVFKLIASGLHGQANTLGMYISGRRIDVSYLDNNTTDKIIALTEKVINSSSCIGKGGFMDPFGKDSYRYSRIFQIAKTQRGYLTKRPGNNH